MVRLVVVAAVFAKGLEKRDAAGGKEKVGTRDHQQHRHKEEQDHRACVLDRRAQPVARAQRDQAQQRDEPAGLGLTLADLRAAQKLDRAGKVDLTHGIEQDQAEGDADEKGRVAHGSGRDGKRERDRLPHQMGEQKVHQLVQQDAHRQPQQQADEQHEHRFPENQAGEVPLFHAQNVVQAELLFAAAHEEAVGIEQKDHAENGGDHDAQLEGKGQGTRIIGGDVLQGTHDVHHGRGEDGG